jgi:hypothetical protein
LLQEQEQEHRDEKDILETMGELLKLYTEANITTTLHHT